MGQKEQPLIEFIGVKCFKSLVFTLFFKFDIALMLDFRLVMFLLYHHKTNYDYDCCVHFRWHDNITWYNKRFMVVTSFLLNLKIKHSKLIPLRRKDWINFGMQGQPGENYSTLLL